MFANSITPMERNMKGLTNIHINSTPMLSNEQLNRPIDRALLTSTDIQLLELYSGRGYIYINSFLYMKHYNIPSISSHMIIQLLMKQYPVTISETIAEYRRRLLYYCFVNLYIVIQKYPSYEMPFKVCRYIDKHYLSTDISSILYLNSFTSTTISSEVCNTYGKLIYVFYIHPSCRYMYIGDISPHPDEKEIIVAPFDRYKFIKITTDKDKTYYHYTVFPTDLQIPNSYEEFVDFKNLHISRITPRNNYYGGSRIKKSRRKNISKRTRRNNRYMESTIHTHISNISTNKTVLSNKTVTKGITVSSIKLNMEYNLHYRMSQPMTMSSYTRPATKEEIELSNKMASLFINLEDVI